MNSVIFPFQPQRNQEHDSVQLQEFSHRQKMKHSFWLVHNLVLCLLTQGLTGKYLLIGLQKEPGKHDGKITLVMKLRDVKIHIIRQALFH